MGQITPFSGIESVSDHEVPSLTPAEAHQLLSDQPAAVLIDVRSNMEFLFVGHPQGALHVPWIDEPDWNINPDFVRDVRKVVLGGSGPASSFESVAVVLICRSGKRSLEAGKQLVLEGFTNVYNVSEGFEGGLDGNHHRSAEGGWRYHNLPWEQC